jgi:hypothetical protein
MPRRKSRCIWRLKTVDISFTEKARSSRLSASWVRRLDLPNDRAFTADVRKDLLRDQDITGSRLRHRKTSSPHLQNIELFMPPYLEPPGHRHRLPPSSAGSVLPSVPKRKLHRRKVRHVI